MYKDNLQWDKPITANIKEKKNLQTKITVRIKKEVRWVLNASTIGWTINVTIPFSKTSVLRQWFNGNDCQV